MDINSTLPPLLDPLSTTIQGFVNIVQFLVGGIFGLYLILVIMRWYEARMLRKLMTEMRDEIRNLNKNLNPKVKKK